MPLGVYLCRETRRCSGKDKIFLQRAFFLTFQLHSSSFQQAESSKMALKIFFPVTHCYLQEAGKSERINVPPSNLTSSNNIIPYVGLLMLFLFPFLVLTFQKRKSLKLADKFLATNSESIIFPPTYCSLERRKDLVSEINKIAFQNNHST